MTARRHDPAIRFDSRKAATNPRKQGITFEEAASVFEDDLSAYTDVDAEHSDNDLRFFTIGTFNRGKLLYISHNERESRIIRLISARRANSRERAFYEED